jgi:hypothetical protein
MRARIHIPTQQSKEKQHIPLLSANFQISMEECISQLHCHAADK